MKNGFICMFIRQIGLVVDYFHMPGPEVVIFIDKSARKYCLTSDRNAANPKCPALIRWLDNDSVEA